jgi:prepilin signal peptidase PulO-like enzyme (type II secretory pathway)
VTACLHRSRWHAPDRVPRLIPDAEVASAAVSAGVVVLCAVLGAVAGAVAVIPALRIIPETWNPPVQVQIAVIIVNGLLWALAANRFSRWWVLAPYLVVFSIMVAVSVVDLRLYRIPDRFVFPGLLITIGLIVIGSFVVRPSASDAIRSLAYAGTGLIAYFGILFIAHILSPSGMGFGDVKLAALMGLSLGWLATSYGSAVYLVLIALIIGCVLGIVFGLVWRMVQHNGRHFPFGPALALGFIYVVLTFDRYLI